MKKMKRKCKKVRYDDVINQNLKCFKKPSETHRSQGKANSNSKGS